MAKIVHEADLDDERHDAPEAAGLDVLLRGLAMVRTDDERLALAGTLFDGFDEFCSRASDRQGARLLEAGTDVISDRDRIMAAQAVRAFAYGMGAVVLGTSLAARGWSTTRVGALLGCVLAGTILASVLVATRGDRIGRRRLYAALFIALGRDWCRVRVDRPVLAAGGRVAARRVVHGSRRVRPVHLAGTADACRTYRGSRPDPCVRHLQRRRRHRRLARRARSQRIEPPRRRRRRQPDAVLVVRPRRPARRADRRVALPGGRSGRSGGDAHADG